MLNCACMQVATNEMYATHRGIIEGNQTKLIAARISLIVPPLVVT